MFKRLYIDEFVRVIKLLKDKKKQFYWALALSSIAYPTMYILYGLVNKKLVDAVQLKDIHLLKSALVLTVIIILIACIFDPITAYIRGSVIRKIMLSLRIDCFKHMVKLPVTYFDNNHSGEIISILINDLNSLENVFGSNLRMLIVSIFTGVGSIALMLAIEWKLTLIMIILGYVSFLINILFVDSIRKLSDKVQEYTGKSSKQLVEVMNSIKIIKIFNIKNVLLQEYLSMNDNVAKVSEERSVKSAQLDSMNAMLSALNFIGILCIGVILINFKLTSLSNVVAAMSLQNNVTFMFLNTGKFFTAIQSSLAGADRIFKMLDWAIEKDKLSEKNADCFVGDEVICFDNVYFSYDGDTEVLKGINMTIEKCKMIALVGASGCGKTTVLKLLQAFYIPKSGKIKIFKNPIESYSIKQLRDKISYVPQDSFLFNCSIEENIRYGKVDATKEEIVTAAKMANIHEFVISLENGYDTIVGERGELLSGGQRQRIALARAIIKKAPIVLLDEVTSALDSESEHLIQKTIETISKEYTVIIIAHRLSTIEKADKIFVFDNGKIVEQGAQIELVRLNGVFNKLYMQQFLNAVTDQ